MAGLRRSASDMWSSCFSYKEAGVESPGPVRNKPSLFRGGLVGYLLAALIGAVVCWGIAVHVGDFSNQKSFTILVCFGAAGALEGYHLTARRRKRMGVAEPSDEWHQFVSSWAFKGLAALVLAGSFAVSLGESLLFDLAYGAPWLHR